MCDAVKHFLKENDEINLKAHCVMQLSLNDKMHPLNNMY